MDKHEHEIDWGTPEEWVAHAKEFFGLRPDQSFQELKIPIVITKEQREMLQAFLPDLQRYLDDEDIIPLLKAVEEKINEIGYDTNHQLNATGQRLKKLYDDLYEQN